MRTNFLLNKDKGPCTHRNLQFAAEVATLRQSVVRAEFPVRCCVRIALTVNPRGVCGRQLTKLICRKALFSLICLICLVPLTACRVIAAVACQSFSCSTDTRVAGPTDARDCARPFANKAQVLAQHTAAANTVRFKIERTMAIRREQQTGVKWQLWQRTGQLIPSFPSPSASSVYYEQHRKRQATHGAPLCRLNF